jgi:hypothetical protein
MCMRNEANKRIQFERLQCLYYHVIECGIDGVWIGNLIY